MGGIIQARCDCGYESDDLLLGGGMMSSPTYCGAPALCDACGSLEVLNLLGPLHHCETCGGPVQFYHELAGPTDAGERLVFAWGLGGWAGDKEAGFALPDVAYPCPSCRKRQMHFFNVGCWD